MGMKCCWLRVSSSRQVAPFAPLPFHLALQRRRRNPYEDRPCRVQVRRTEDVHISPDTRSRIEKEQRTSRGILATSHPSPTPSAGAMANPSRGFHRGSYGNFSVYG